VLGDLIDIEAIPSRTHNEVSSIALLLGLPLLIQTYQYYEIFMLIRRTTYELQILYALNLLGTISNVSTVAMLLSVDNRGDGGTFEQGALLKKFSIKPSVGSTRRYFCVSRVVPLLSM